ncbi:MAG TPA: hypothetical protein VFV38_05395 [Ktedonobacteraceae bacterium]|nr:hypothetical protein [Ktedonobacteraceae bacterium]
MFMSEPVSPLIRWRYRRRSLLAMGLLLLMLLAGCGVGTGQRVASATATSASSGTSLNLAPQPTLPGNPTPFATPTVKVPTSANLAPATLPPGATLPSEAQCAASVKRAAFEPRPNNSQANHAVPTSQQIADLTPWDAKMGQDPRADALRKQISGNFTGTTDEILQWVACKWGVQPNLVRAEAVVESTWQQSQRGDYTSDQTLCPPGTWDGKGCYQSYGILQLKYVYFKSTWPMSQTDTAFNAEYVYGTIRACYEGWTTYLKERTPLPGYPRYHAGDIWGCLGRWYSGGWYDQGAVDYISKVKATLAGKAWLQAGF